MTASPARSMALRSMTSTVGRTSDAAVIAHLLTRRPGLVGFEGRESAYFCATRVPHASGEAAADLVQERLRLDGLADEAGTAVRPRPLVRQDRARHDHDRDGAELGELLDLP